MYKLRERVIMSGLVSPTAQVTLTKWGNGQGFLIPRALCDFIGISVGDKLDIEADGAGGIAIRPHASKFVRTQHVDIATLFEGWEGEYEPPSDWPTIGNEIDWGSPVGKEMW